MERASNIFHSHKLVKLTLEVSICLGQHGHDGKHPHRLHLPSRSDLPWSQFQQPSSHIRSGLPDVFVLSMRLYLSISLITMASAPTATAYATLHVFNEPKAITSILAAMLPNSVSCLFNAVILCHVGIYDGSLALRTTHP